MNSKALSPRQLIRSLLFSKGRMEALTDGIFAIAMTLLVLELKVPDLPRSIGSAELFHKLAEEGPAFFSFVISFLYCGLLWYLHHTALHFIRHIKIGLVWLNLLFLMSISILPFSCGILGHFLRNRTAQEIYFGNLLVASILLAAQWWLAKRLKLVNEDDPQAVRVMGQDLSFLPPAVAAAMVGSYFYPMGGFYAMVFVLLPLRLWQKLTFKKQTESTRNSPSS